MKKMILLITIIAVCSVSVAAPASDSKLHGIVDATYVSRFIWRGCDSYGQNHSAFQPSVDLDLFGTGFGVYVWSSRANSSGFENSEWLTVTPYYKGMLWGDEVYATAYKIGYTYFGFPDEPQKGSSVGDGHFQEVFAGFAWPKIFGGKLVPSYLAAASWPSRSDAFNSENGGWAHVFALNYDIMVGGLINPDETQKLQLGVHTVYNDSVGPMGSSIDHDWTHAVFTVALEFPINKSLTFTPSFNYQSSWDDSLNTQDEYWTGLSLSYKF